MKPRVLVATTYYHPVVGGVETHARQLVRHLVRRGFTVQVVTKRVSAADPAQQTIDGAAVHRVPPAGERSSQGKWLAAPFFFSTALALRSTFDVIVCIDYRGIGVGSVAAARLLGRPVIVQAGTAGVLAPPGPDSGVPNESELEQLGKTIPRAVYRAADQFVCISRDIEREALLAGIPRARVHYLPHGVDLDRFRPAAPEERGAIRRQRGWPVDTLVVLFVGRLSVEKGVLDLLEAWRILARTDALLAVVGPDMPEHPWDAGHTARTFVTRHGLGEAVRFEGVAEDTSPFYRAADVFVQPSHFEAFGISAIEAMASGVAVVASRVGGLQDFLTHDVNGLLHEPRNPESLAGAIREALDSAALRNRLASAALQAATTLFDERVLLDRYADLIESTVGTR